MRPIRIDEVAKESMGLIRNQTDQPEIHEIRENDIGRQSRGLIRINEINKISIRLIRSQPETNEIKQNH